MWQLVAYSWRSNYTVFWLTEWFHSWPHVEYKSFQLVDSSFQPDSEEYLETLLFLAAIPLALLLVTLLSVFFYCCYGVCKSRRRSSSSVQTSRQKSSSRKWIVAIVAFICLGFVVIGFYGNEETSTGINRVTNAAKDVDVTVDEIARELNVLNETYSTVIPSDVQRLSEIFNNYSRNATVQDELLKLTATLAEYVSSSAESMADISRDVNSVQFKLKSTASDVEQYDYFRWLGTIVLFCLEIVVCLVALCAVGKASRCLLIFVSVLCVIFIILIWCRMGVELFFTIAASDFCINPNTYVTARIEEKSEIDQDIILYYLTCSQKAINPYGEPLSNAQKSQTLAETTMETIQQMSSTYYPEAADTLSNLDSTFVSGNIQLQQIIADIDCDSLNTDYMMGLYSLCYDTITGLSLMMMSSVLSGIFFTVLIFISSCTVPVIAKRKADYEVDREDPFLPPDNQSATLERYSRHADPHRSPQRRPQAGHVSPTIPDYNREPSFAASSVAYNQEYRYEDDPLLRRHGPDSPPPSYAYL